MKILSSEVVIFLAIIFLLNACGSSTGNNPDTIAPSVPTGLTASVIGGGGIALSWNASTDNMGVAGYKIYRNGSYHASTSGALSFSDTGLTLNTQYCYQVSSYDASNNESQKSGQQCATPGGGQF